jgi:CRP-like cAMP-binding protein
VGVLLYYLMPTAYVDATDIALAPRRRRIAVSLAGPFADLLIVAVCGYIAWLSPESAVGGLAFKAGTLLTFDLVLNLLPILELDGYHVLTEALEAPFLRQRALAFVRSDALGKARRRERWSRAEVGLAAFGLSAVVSSALVVVFAFQLWSQRLAAPVTELLGSGPLGALLVGLIAIALLGPTLLRLPSVAGRILRAIARAPGRLRRRSTITERVAALRQVAFLRDLEPGELVSIATHLGEQSVDSGEVVVTIGEPGDRFYIVRSGALEAISERGEHLNAIGAGEGFGELALLDRTTRSATVRALRASAVWWLDRAHFHRWVAARIEVAARIRASSEERAALGRLPIFAGLAAPELDRVAAQLRLSRVRQGEAVFRAGERADRYYVIRSGVASVVLPDGTAVRELGVGDAFGELGLLLSVPRTASVVATSDLVLASLAGSDFSVLVKESADRLAHVRAGFEAYLHSDVPRPG